MVPFWCRRSTGSTSDYELHFISRLNNSVHPAVNGYLALFRAGEGQKAVRKGTGHPTSSCRGLVMCFSNKAHPLRYNIVWDTFTYLILQYSKKVMNQVLNVTYHRNARIVSPHINAIMDTVIPSLESTFTACELSPQVLSYK